jgi:HSP20 family protein
METEMADVPVEVRKAAPAETALPDMWRSFRSEFDRLFDRFGFPSLRRMFEVEPGWRAAGGFPFSAPPIDLSEDEKAYRITAELPGLDAKDVELSVSDGRLILKGEKRRRKKRKRTIISPSAPTARFSECSNCRQVSSTTRSPPTFPRAC